MKYTAWLMLVVFAFGCEHQAKSISPIVESRVNELSSVLTMTRSVDVKTDESLVLLKGLVSKVDTLQSAVADAQEAIGTLAVKEEPVAVVVTDENPSVVPSHGTSEYVFTDDDMKPVDTTDGVRLQFWTATWCGLCPGAKETSQAAADKLGVTLEEFDIDVYANQKKKCRVHAPPTLCIIHDGMTRRWLIGPHTEADILSAVESVKRGEVPVQSVPTVSQPVIQQQAQRFSTGMSYRWNTFSRKRSR